MDQIGKVGPHRALLVSVIKEGDGFRICLDDVVRDAETTKLWRQAEHVTNKFMPASSIEEMQFAENELFDFGYYVFARLNAFVKRGEN